MNHRLFRAKLLTESLNILFVYFNTHLTCFLRASKAALMVWTRVLSLAFANSLLVCWMALTSGRRPGPSSLTLTRLVGES